MKSNIKLLIISAAALVLVIGAAAAVSLMGSGDSEEETEETTAAAQPLSRLIYDKDPAAITNIHVSNETGEYDVVKHSENAWFVEDFIGAPHSAAAIDDILDSAAVMTSEQVAAENAEDMSVYGLSEPRAKVEVSFGGETKSFSIGSDSPSPGLTYLCFDGENTVHAVNTSAVDVFLNDRFYFIAKTVYSVSAAADGSVTAPRVNSVTVSRKDIDYDIVLEYDIRQEDDDAIIGNSSTHRMTEPVTLDLDPDKSYDAINSVFGLTADEVAVIAPTEEIMAQFGLDDPFGEVYFDIEGNDFRMLMGNRYADENGKDLGRYCYVEGIDIIYMFGNSKLPWAEIVPLDISMTMITSTYIYTISSIDVEYDGKSTHFDLSGGQDAFTVTCGEGDIDPDKFKTFYQYILRAPAEEIYLEENSDPADITVTISHEYGTDVLEFISSDDRKSVIRLNGRTSFKCRTAYAARLGENLERLLSGDDIIETW